MDIVLYATTAMYIVLFVFCILFLMKIWVMCSEVHEIKDMLRRISSLAERQALIREFSERISSTNREEK